MDRYVERLREMDAATVHEAAGRTGHLAPSVRPVQEGVVIAGRAVTAECHPGDNLAIHRAILEAEPGDVLVAAARGHVAGYWGEIMAVAAQARGILGLVIDGGCRDVAALRGRDFPVWSTGISVHGCVKLTAGRIQVPVVVAGVAGQPRRLRHRRRRRGRGGRAGPDRRGARRRRCPRGEGSGDHASPRRGRDHHRPDEHAGRSRMSETSRDLDAVLAERSAAVIDGIERIDPDHVLHLASSTLKLVLEHFITGPGAAGPDRLRDAA